MGSVGRPAWDRLSDADRAHLATRRPPGSWSCVAYGPDAPASAVCFVGVDRRTCADLAVCTETMRVERQSVYRRIQELAAAGDPVWRVVAEEFPTPDGLLYPDDAT